MTQRHLKFQNSKPLLAFMLLIMVKISMSKLEMGNLKPDKDKSQGKELISGDFNQQEIVITVPLTAN